MMEYAKLMKGRGRLRKNKGKELKESERKGRNKSHDQVRQRRGNS